jgi:hypothetical protein
MSNLLNKLIKIVFMSSNFCKAFYLISSKPAKTICIIQFILLKVASGDTLTFLDAHIEATHGWLVPLLNEVKKNRFDFFCNINC